jgi:GNAT superfamily N-acetyltransferase
MEIFIKATRDDLSSILELQKECYLEEAKIYNQFDIPPLKEDLASIANEFEKGIILKCLADDLIVGSVRGFSLEGTCYIGKLIVRKEFQNKGLGKKLMDAVESHFPYCNRFELFTGFRSEKNLYLYHKLGYTEFKRKEINEGLTLVFLEKIS